MRYIVYVSILALALYAATAEDIYKIYKSKGIGAVEEFLKKEFEHKESPKEVAKTVVKEPAVTAKEVKAKEQPIRVAKPRVPKKAPSEKEAMSRDYWLKQLRNVDVSYGYYENLDSLIVCEKDKKRCDIFQADDSGVNQIKTHDAIMGKSGDKIKRGDLKTPVGVYEITRRFKPTDQFYGPLAFSLSYPNLYDSLRGRTGSGIWIHGMPLDGVEREDLSKGCVVMDNEAIVLLDSEINPKNTLTIIGEDRVPKMSKELVATILSDLYKWQNSWRVNDIKNYLNYYAKDFKKSDGSGIKAFSDMKNQIFSRKEKKTIIFENISLSPYPTTDDKKMYKISFHQTYKAPSFSSKGDKELYIEMIGNKMQILAEK